MAIATTGIIKGRDIKLYSGGIVIDDQLDLTLNIQRDIQEITTKQSTGQWKEFMYNFQGATGTLSGYWSMDATESVKLAFDDMKAGTAVVLKWSTTVVGDFEYTATALITEISKSFPKDGPATFSLNFTVSGAVAYTEITS